MGHRSTLIVFHDELHDIKKDSEFGKKVFQAISQFGRHGGLQPYRPEGDGFRVIESDHADAQKVLIVSGYDGQEIAWSYNAPFPEAVKSDEEMLRKWADEMGFYLRRKPSVKPRLGGGEN